MKLKKLKTQKQEQFITGLFTENTRHNNLKFRKDHTYHIITHHGSYAGYLIQDNNTKEVSIAVKESFRRKGIALYALKNIEGKARIRPDNIPSLNLFTKAGFTFKRYKDNLLWVER